jgi:hypothetical protein
MRGTVEVVARESNGDEVWRRIFENTIVDVLRTLVRRRLGDGTLGVLPVIKYIRFGSDTSGLGVGNVALAGDYGVNRAVNAPTYPSGTQIQLTYTIPLVDVLNGKSIGEAGLFSDTVVADPDFGLSGQRLFARAVFVPPPAKSGAITLEYIWTLTL